MFLLSLMVSPWKEKRMECLEVALDAGIEIPHLCTMNP